MRRLTESQLFHANHSKTPAFPHMIVAELLNILVNVLRRL